MRFSRPRISGRRPLIEKDFEVQRLFLDFSRISDKSVFFCGGAPGPAKRNSGFSKRERSISHCLERNMNEKCFSEDRDLFDGDVNNVPSPRHSMIPFDDFQTTKLVV